MTQATKARAGRDRPYLEHARAVRKAQLAAARARKLAANS